MGGRSTITRVDLVNMIARENLMRPKDVNLVLDALIQNVTFALHSGHRVKIAGFGAFEMKHRNARTGRNPHTGEAVPIPARNVPSFTPDGKLKKATKGDA